MARANAAYYASHDPFRDFTTAPEIGQVFGELVGAWAAVAWAELGRPDPVLLVEAGPGRGTMMRDALRAAGRLPGFLAACRLHLIETSPALRAAQAAALPKAAWHEDLAEVPAGPAIVLANEFLDALPVRQFVRRNDGWIERFVSEGAFVELPAAPGVGPAQAGSVIERGEAALAWVTELAVRLREQDGAALLLDYGGAGSGDTLQALRNGRGANPLADPGCADLTAHVDFGALLHAARAAGARGWGPVPQGEFLVRLGLRPRTAALAAANPDRADELREAADRLAHPDRMGQLFQAVAITRLAAPAPPGFAP